MKLVEFATNTAIPKFIEFAANLKEIVINLKSALAGLATAIPIVTVGLVACNKTVQLFVAKMIAAKVAVLATNAALLANPYTAVAVALGALIAANVRFTEETNRLLEVARNQTTEFSKMRDEVEANVSAFRGAIQESASLASANNEQINQIRNLTNMLMEYANKTELTSDELSKAQDIISQLNEIYPENTATFAGVVSAVEQVA